MGAGTHGKTGAEGTQVCAALLPRAGWERGGSAGPRSGASRSGKFIKTAKLLMFLDVHQDWISYFNYLT